MSDLSFIFIKPEFMKYAKCIGSPTEWWFPVHGASRVKQDDLRKAKALCEVCVVKAECRQYGEQTRSSGVWGGVTLDRGRPSTRGKRNKNRNKGEQK